MTCLRALLFVWLASAISCAIWPLFNGWAEWPAEAQAYAQWAIYRAEHLPLASHASLLGIALLLVGAALLFFRLSAGVFVFSAGLLLHAYSKYVSIPTIAESAELGLYAAFYLMSGVVMGVSFRSGSHAHPPSG